MNNSDLQEELSTYTRELPLLLSKAGKFVLIKGSNVIGIYDSYEDALSIGYQRFGLEPFLVKRIAPAEQISFFSRHLLTECQA